MEWDVEWRGLSGRYSATTRSKARYRAYLQLRDIGYKPRLIDIQVRRAKGGEA